MNLTICPLNKAFGLSPDRFILQILRFANCSKKPYLAAVIKSQNLKIDFFMKNTKRCVQGACGRSNSALAFTTNIKNSTCTRYQIPTCRLRCIKITRRKFSKHTHQTAFTARVLRQNYLIYLHVMYLSIHIIHVPVVTFINKPCCTIKVWAALSQCIFTSIRNLFAVIEVDECESWTSMCNFNDASVRKLSAAIEIDGPES